VIVTVAFLPPARVSLAFIPSTPPTWTAEKTVSGSTKTVNNHVYLNLPWDRLHPHAGVDFTITGGELPAGGTVVTTDADGIACLDGLVFATDYVVTESVPAGYISDMR